MINLRQVRDGIKLECDNRESCTGCVFDRFRLGVCMIRNITDAELEQLAELFKDNKNVSEYRKRLVMEQMEIEL